MKLWWPSGGDLAFHWVSPLVAVLVATILFAFGKKVPGNVLISSVYGQCHGASPMLRVLQDCETFSPDSEGIYQC